MAEEWSGSSLGSSFLNDDGEFSLSEDQPGQEQGQSSETNEYRQSQSQSQGGGIEETEEGSEAQSTIRSSVVDREMKLLTQKYLSRGESAATTVVMSSSSHNNNEYSFDRSLQQSQSQSQARSVLNQTGDTYQGMHSFSENTELTDDQSQGVQAGQGQGSPHSSESSHDMLELLLPAFTRFNKLLNENGCLTAAIDPADLDVPNRSISVFVLDSWAESVTDFVGEVLEHRQSSRESVMDASFEVQRSDVSMTNLDVEIHHLRERLDTAKNKEKDLRMKCAQSDELIEKLQKHSEDMKFDHGLKIKHFESLCEEKDRKLRKTELEADKMREKLRQLTNKDRTSSTKAANTLKSYQRGAEVVSSPLKPGKSGKRSGGGGDSVVSVDDVLQAMEIEQQQLTSQNEELEKQVSSLTKRLKKVLNENKSGTTKNKVKDVSVTPSIAPSSDESLSSDARVLSDKVREQSQRIRQIQHQYEAEMAKVKTQNEDMNVMRKRAAEMREEIHNLRLEIESRPTMSQWKTKTKELAVLESKLHDVVMMKGEAEELMNWRKHLSTSDRIKADRRNHELKLWLLESLPKSVMQEVLQNLCREMDVSDVSEIHAGIVKMKTVIRAVPRMEQFITSVCNFVFQKDRPRHPEGDINTRPSMEDAIPILNRWWDEISNSKQYTKFQQDVAVELMRMDNMENRPPVRSSLLDSPADFERNIDMKGGKMPAKWSGGPGSEVSALQKIKSLVDFQVELFRSSKSFVDAQTFISERPEVLVNSLVEHIRYLFGIKSLQGMIPRMNEVYLFSEEMCNFINNSRQMMQMTNLPDATVLTEIYRRIKLGGAANKPAEDDDSDSLDPTEASSMVSDFVDDSSDYLRDS